MEGIETDNARHREDVAEVSVVINEGVAAVAVAANELVRP